jgi:hypothetical protein
VYDRDFDYDYFGFKVTTWLRPEAGLLKGCSRLPSPPFTARRHQVNPAPTPLALVDFVCLQTLERSYMLRVNGKVVERPQHMLMRVAVGIHMEDVDAGQFVALIIGREGQYRAKVWGAHADACGCGHPHGGC